MDNDGCDEYTTRLNNAFRRASIAIVGEENYELYCNKDKNKSLSIRNNIDEHHQRRDLKLNSEDIKKQQMIEEFILQEQKKQLSSRFDENSVDKEGINPIQDDGDADDKTDIHLFPNNKDQDRRIRERATSTNSRPSVRYTEKDLEMNHEITSKIDDVLKEISLNDRETSMKLSDFLVKHLSPKK